jgi:hypothetical protein
MNVVRWAMPLALLAALLASGCAQLKAGPYSPSYEALDQLKRQAPLAKTRVAELQPRDAKAAVNQISLRGASMGAAQGSFTAYLQDALIADLKELGAYDPQASTRIDATLLKNGIDISGFTTGTGAIEIELVVTRDDTQRLKKKYAANTQFESSFAGAVAVPKAMTEYPALARALLAKVYADPEFARALKP